MTERILIPLDGSKFGEAALHYVEKLISKMEPASKPEITLLHVLSPEIKHIAVEGGVVDVLNKTPDIQQAKEKAVDYLSKAGEKLKEHRAKVNCQVIINEMGTSSAEIIIKSEKDYKADLVAMSTHGRRGITRWAFGSVTEKVLKGGSVPVLMVRANSTR